jgi:lysophospholipase L1-like esterase
VSSGTVSTAKPWLTTAADAENCFARVRRTLASVVVMVLALAASLVVLEVCLRVVRPAEGCKRNVPLWRPSPAVGWALVPGAVGDEVLCGPAGRPLVRHRIEVNALGQRDRPRRYTRQPGVPRVAVLGDSFVEALQVSLDETFAARIERMLGLEVLNLGVSGYSTDNELRAFLARGRRYRPDVVVLLVFLGNDVMENGARLYLKNPHGLPPKPWLRAVAPSPALRRCLAVHRGAAALASRTPGMLWSHSRLTRALLTSGITASLGLACDTATGPPLTPGVPEILGVYGEPATVGWREGWRTTERTIVRLDRRVRATGARFGVVVVPPSFEIDATQNVYLAMYPQLRERAWDYGYPERRLRSFLDELGVPVLSLVDALRTHRAETGKLGYYAWDGHWDADGHAVVADAVAPFVRTLLSQ